MAAKYSNTITALTGSALGGATVQAVNAQGAYVTLYSDLALTTPVNAQTPTTATTDTTGYIEFYVADGTYTIVITYQGTSRRFANVQLYDVARINYRSTTPQDYGAVGDGSADDTAAITAANAATGRKFSPAGTYKTSLVATALDGPFWGDGQIKTGSNKRAPWFCAIKSAPASLGDESSIDTAFNGDMSKCQLAIEHRITGAATLGQPASGYMYTPGTAAIYGYLYNTSGWNQSTNSNDGRTAAVFARGKVYQIGQGDCVVWNAAATVGGARAGATHFLANPAASLFNGDMTAIANGVYMNPEETNCTDNGFDVAYVGHVLNGTRTVNTGALSVWWGGYRVQSNGSQAWDNIFSASGKFNAGIDFTPSGLDFGTNKRGLSLKADVRIGFNDSSSNGNYATTFNGWYLEYSSGLSGMQFVANGASTFQMTAAQVTVNGVRFLCNNAVSLTALSNYANDAAAAAGSVPVGGLYRNGSVVQVRVT